MNIETARYLVLHRDRFKPHTKEWLKKFLKFQYKYYMNKDLNLENPRTFNEKLAWLKLYWDDERLSICADKAKAPLYAQNEAQEVRGHTVRQLSCWENERDFDFDSLPPSFALKLNCGSGKNILVPDKSKINILSVKNQLLQWLKPEENHYFAFFEQSYKNIPSKIVVEELINFDFKVDFFCFSGIPHLYRIKYNDKAVNPYASYFDMEGNLLEMTQHFPKIPFKVNKPPHFKIMAICAKKLSQGFPHVRIDFYCSLSTWYFCEMTFYHDAGLHPFTPDKYDTELGALIKLPPPITT